MDKDKPSQGAKATSPKATSTKATSTKATSTKATSTKGNSLNSGGSPAPVSTKAATAEPSKPAGKQGSRRAPIGTASIPDVRVDSAALTDMAQVMPEIAAAAVPDVDVLGAAAPMPINGGVLRRWFNRQTDVSGASKVALFTLFGVNMVDEFDRLAFATLTPEIRDAFDLTDQQIVAVGSVSAIFVFLAAIPVGYLADRMSRIKMARAAAAMWGCMAVLTGAAWAIPVLFAARFFSGVAKSSNELVHTGLLADYYPPHTIPRVFKVHRLANPLSQVASLVAGGIALAAGWRWAFFMLALPTFVLLGALWRLEEPDRGATIDPSAARAAVAKRVKPPSYWQVTKQLFRIRSLRRLWLGAFVYGFGALAIGQMLSLFFEKIYDFGPLGRGVISFIYGAGTVVGIVRGGNIGSARAASGDFAYLAKVVAAGIGIFSFGLLAMGVSPWWWLSLLAAPVAAAGIGMTMPTFPSLTIRILPPMIRSQGYSFTLVAIAIGALFAIPLAGLGDSEGYRPAFVLLSLIVFASGPIMYSAHRLVDADIREADRALQAARA